MTAPILQVGKLRHKTDLVFEIIITVTIANWL